MNPVCDTEDHRKEVTFEDLPTELIVLIFSHLSPEDLACHVSDVCIRWRDVSRDFALWGNKSLIYDESRPLQFQRTILFAPFLARLEINMFKYMNSDSIQSILRGCQSLLCLSFYPSPVMPVNFKFLILNHYKMSLKELNMFIDDSYLVDGCDKSVFKILCNMPRLKCLTLRGHISSQFLPNNIFCNGWERLESLEISGLTVLYDSVKLSPPGPNPWQNFILNMLAFKACTLRKLSLPGCVFDHSAVDLFTAKFVFSSIENLKICEMCLLSVKNLNSLRTLYVKGMSSKYANLLRTDCLLAGQEYSSLFDWVNETPQFLNVRELTLESIVDDERNLTLNILNACKNLESFTFSSACHTSAQLASIITQLPSLRKLSIHRTPCLRSRHLDLIISYQPNLQILNLRYNILTDGILQYYRDHVQGKMPNLKLLCDWGYWSQKGGQPWFRPKHSTTAELFPKSVMLESNVPSSSSSPGNLPINDREKLRMVLDSVNDYDDDD